MKRPRWINRTFLSGALCGVLAVFATGLFINETTLADHMVRPLLHEDSTSSADMIVVPGAGVTGECTPNQNGVRRVLLAARLWQERRAPALLFTGGMAGGECPVAEAMARLAQQIGVPASAIRTETDSRSTRENGERSAALLQREGAHRILVVTDRLHMRRAAGVFARLGFDVQTVSVPIYEGHTNNVSMLVAGARETAALMYYRMNDWLAPVPAPRRRADTGPRASVGTAGSATGQEPDRSVMQKVSNPAGPVVLLGASYAGSWKIDRFDGVPIVNAGKAGQQSFEMLERFDRDVVAARPRAVILWGFINDIFRAEDMERSLARVRQSYTDMIARARAGGIEPILATEVTIRPSDSWTDTAKTWVGWVLGKQSHADRVNGHVMAINTWLRDLARKERLTILDLHGALADRSGARRREFIADDGSHITAAGYEALTRYAVPLLSAHFSVPQAR